MMRRHGIRSASSVTRVVVDGRGLGDASAYRGIGTYLRNVLGGLALEPDLDVSALVGHGVAVPPGVQALPVRRAAPPRWSTIEHELLLPLALSRSSADVVFSPAQDPPRQCATPWVQTIHGVLPLLGMYPELERERRRWQRIAPRVRRAAAVITVSRHCADTAITALDLDPARVHVVPHGVSPAFNAGQAWGRSTGQPYLLYVGEHGPWKGYAEAFEVAGRVAAAGHPHCLKVAGRVAPWVRPEVDELIRRAPEPSRIELLGHVAPDDLPQLYRGATALIVTSRFESFGLMSVEAMACGTPVVAFSNTATAEVVGRGGLLIPDGDVTAFAAAVTSVITDEHHRAELSAAGLERARAFSWERSVAAHAALLRAVARS